RNTWAWKEGQPKPVLRKESASSVIAEHSQLGRYQLWADCAGLINTGLQPGDIASESPGNRLNGFSNDRTTHTGLKPGVNEIVGPEFLFCENETNVRRLFGSNATGYFKDGFDEHIVHGREAAVNPDGTGTKAGVLYKLEIPAHGSATVRLRLYPVAADVR